MLHKEDIIKMVKEMNLPKNQYWITSGAGLVIHGVKDSTGDIDLGCTTELFNQLLKKGYKYKVADDNTRIMEINDSIEILENWFVDEIEIIEDLPVGSLVSIKKQKAELGREKDFRDIKLIDEYLKVMTKENIFKELPQLETERLILRKINMNDAKDLFEYGSNPQITKYVCWQTYKSEEDAVSFINKTLKQYENGAINPWGIVIKEHNKLIGTCGFIRYEPDHNKGELAYALSCDYWNKGIMTEAVKKVIEFGFKKMNLNKVQARCIKENIGSEKVMIKSGMNFDGILRNDVLFKDNYIDLKVYSILKREYNDL